jgi:hypothetical protein
MTNSVLVESAAAEDLELDYFEDPYSGALTAGSYVVADPGVILKDSDYEEWLKVATISETQFGQYGNGHDGLIRSARINGHPVTGFTVYAGFEEFKDSSGNVYESAWQLNDPTILAVFPTALLDELEIKYSADHVFEITEKDVQDELNSVYYSTRTHRMFVGHHIEIYTGELSGPEEEIEAENLLDEELYDSL